MSPLVTISKLLRPEDVVEYFADFIKSSSLPFAYVAKYNELLIPEYPAVRIMSGGFQKEFHGTHTWALTLRADIYVMHAKLTESRETREYNDLLLASQLVELIETDLTLGQRVIAGWVETETPGAMPARSKTSDTVVSTLLKWRGTQEARF